MLLLRKKPHKMAGQIASQVGSIQQKIQEETRTLQKEPRPSKKPTKKKKNVESLPCSGKKLPGKEPGENVERGNSPISWGGLKRRQQEESHPPKEWTVEARTLDSRGGGEEKAGQKEKPEGPTSRGEKNFARGPHRDI